MRAHHLAIYLPSLVSSGLTRVMLNLSDGLIELGYDVDIVVSRAVGDFREEVPSEAEIVSLNAPVDHKLSTPATRNITALPGLILYLRRETPDVLLSAMNHGSVTSLLARRVARVDTRTAVTVHTHLSTHIQRFQNVRTRLTPAAINLFYRGANRVIAVSNGVADDLAMRTILQRDRIHVIYNPVVSPELLKKANEPVGHPWFEPGEPPVILSVGRLSDHKDYSTLIRAFDQLNSKQDARLIIVGEGNQRQRLEKLVENLGLSEVVDLPGFVGNPYSYMRAASLFVFSSLGDEGLPTVIIEALACQCDVVATDCPSGPAEILDNGTYGRLVPPKSPNELANSMMRSLNNPTDGNILLERALDFSISGATAEYVRLLFDEN